MIKEFKEIREWSEKRGIINNQISEEVKIKQAFLKVKEEIQEISDSINNKDWFEFKDAIGDSIITLINLSESKGFRAEDCLKQAYNTIRFRKGLTNQSGCFIKYNNLNKTDKEYCDKLQGNKGNQYFEDFKEDLINKDFFK